MVQNPRETLCTDAFKLNKPEPIRVQEDSSGFPVTIRTTRRQVIAAIEDRWRIDDEWWRREPVSRLYYAVNLASGQRLVLYKDLTSGCWYRQTH